ncbi:prolyl 4-hydroxylase [Paraburkholderia sp. BL8N3]|jgi:prolyl 4-hydroxylase|nr:2OG-Fe(II) oxygenase [Paraburkholderia sp. BL8N3]TCK34658.1 prolyl 4-hydroxylase [Paraburkholderia sp. BL8N3]
MIVNFPQDVRDWLVAHLERGTPPATITAQLEAQNVPAVLAAAIVDTVAHAVARGAPPPAGQLHVDETPVAAAPFRHDEPLHLGRAPVLDAGDRRVQVLARLERPAVTLLSGLLDARECAALIALARPRLDAVRVVDPQSGEDVIAEHRSSEGMFFRPLETPLVERIERRIEKLTGIPLAHGEGIQVLRYRPGAQSTPHLDFLLPGNAANRESIERSGQRISTMVMYLNDVESGGETAFTEAGLSVTAREGNAVYFQYGNRLGQSDHASVHAGSPVLAGEKWIATKWLRARRFVPRA